MPLSLPLFKPKRAGGVGEPVSGCPAHDSAVGVNIGAGAQFPKAGIGLIVNLPCSLAHFFPGEEVFMSAHAIQPLVDIGLNRGQDELTISVMLNLLVGDRKSVVEGKSVSVRVNLGGRRIIKK